MNVALGGTLVEHLPDEVGEAITHRDERSIWAQHPVQVVAQSKLADVLQAMQPTDLLVASPVDPPPGQIANSRGTRRGWHG